MLKDKVCKQCDAEYRTRMSQRSVCSLPCALEQSRAKLESRELVEAKRAERAGMSGLHF